MVANNPSSRGLGNIAKVYLITCCRSTCSKLKKHEHCDGGIAILYIYIFILTGKLVKNSALTQGYQCELF